MFETDYPHPTCQHPGPQTPAQRPRDYAAAGARRSLRRGGRQGPVRHRGQDLRHLMADADVIAPDLGTAVPGRRGPGARAAPADRPVERRNAFTQDMYRGIKRAAVWADTQPELDAVCLTGTDRWFGAGGDMGGRAEDPEGLAVEWDSTEQFPFRHIERCRKLWVAKVNGLCHAGGLDLTLRCDVAVASDQARFRVPELLRGIPDPFMSARLAEAVGLARARYLFFTADGDHRPRGGGHGPGRQGRAPRRARLPRRLGARADRPHRSPGPFRREARPELAGCPSMDYGLFHRAIERPRDVGGHARPSSRSDRPTGPEVDPHGGRGAAGWAPPGARCGASTLADGEEARRVRGHDPRGRSGPRRPRSSWRCPPSRPSPPPAEAEWPPIDTARFDDFAVRSQVYAADGSLLATLHGVENRQPVTLDQVPDTVKDAILAVEDAEFYQHKGVNVRALTRAMVENVQAGGVEQGGSTITQQLVKNVLLNDERVLNRKVKEAALAIRLENQMSKDQILEAYLNTVYFGSGAYGVQAAAETYWGKNVGDLNWAEGAMLAAVISNPIAYDPTLHPEAAKERRDIALDRMVAYGVAHPGAGGLRQAVAAADRSAARVSPAPVPRTAARSCSPRPTATSSTRSRTSLLDVNHHEYDAALGTTYEERNERGVRRGPAASPPPRTRSPRRPPTTPSATPSRRPPPTRASPWRWCRSTRPAVPCGPSSAGPASTTTSTTSPPTTVSTATGAARRVRRSRPSCCSPPSSRACSPTTTSAAPAAGPTRAAPPTRTPSPASAAPSTRSPAPRPTAPSCASVPTVGRQNVINMAEQPRGHSRPSTPGSSPCPLGVFNVTPLEMASAYSTIPNGGIHEGPYFVDKIEDRSGNVLYIHTVHRHPGLQSRRRRAWPPRSSSTTCRAAPPRTPSSGASRPPARRAPRRTTPTPGSSASRPTSPPRCGWASPTRRSRCRGIYGQEQFGGLYPARRSTTFNKRLPGRRRQSRWPTSRPVRRCPAAVGRPPARTIPTAPSTAGPSQGRPRRPCPAEEPPLRPPCARRRCQRPLPLPPLRHRHRHPRHRPDLHRRRRRARVPGNAARWREPAGPAGSMRRTRASWVKLEP